MKRIQYITASLLIVLTSCQGQSGDVLSPKDFKGKLNQSVTVLDVRTPKEFNSGHLEQAINIDVNGDQFETQSNQLDKTKSVLIYCLSGVRSKRAAQTLRKKGFKVYELKGGIDAWQKEGMPVVK